MIKFGNFEFLIGIEGSKVVGSGQKFKVNHDNIADRFLNLFLDGYWGRLDD